MVTKYTQQKWSQPGGLTYRLHQVLEERSRAGGEELPRSTCLWCNTSTVFSSIYEASWWVIKRKGRGGCVFIRSKPIGQISTFHATTLWLQLVPFWLKQYIHLGHSYFISPILHLIGNVTPRAGGYYRIDLLQGLTHSLRYDINRV